MYPIGIKTVKTGSLIQSPCSSAVSEETNLSYNVAEGKRIIWCETRAAPSNCGGYVCLRAENRQVPGLYLTSTMRSPGGFGQVTVSWPPTPSAILG